MACGACKKKVCTPIASKHAHAPLNWTTMPVIVRIEPDVCNGQRLKEKEGGRGWQGQLRRRHAQATHKMLSDTWGYEAIVSLAESASWHSCLEINTGIAPVLSATYSMMCNYLYTYHWYFFFYTFRNSSNHYESFTSYLYHILFFFYTLPCISNLSLRIYKATLI